MRVVILIIALLAPFLAGCQANNYTQRGLATGGLGGAGLGAMIGEIAADSPIAGAAIGSTVGALTGATVGAGLDELSAEHRAQQAAYEQAVNSGVTLQEVVSMSSAGLSDEIISRHVSNEGFSGYLGADDLIALRQQGVSDRVIAELQTHANRPVRTAATETIVETPVIVQERYHAVPVYGPHCPPPRAWGPAFRVHRHRPGFHWGIAFGQ